MSQETGEYTDEIDASSLRIPLDGRHEYRKDVINQARDRWHTRNKSKAVIRSADGFEQLVTAIEALLDDPSVSDDVKREFADRLESQILSVEYESAAWLEINP